MISSYRELKIVSRGIGEYNLRVKKYRQQWNFWYTMVPIKLYVHVHELYTWWCISSMKLIKSPPSHGPVGPTSARVNSSCGCMSCSIVLSWTNDSSSRKQCRVTVWKIEDNIPHTVYYIRYYDRDKNLPQTYPLTWLRRSLPVVWAKAVMLTTTWSSSFVIPSPLLSTSPR